MNGCGNCGDWRGSVDDGMRAPCLQADKIIEIEAGAPLLVLTTERSGEGSAAHQAFCTPAWAQSLLQADHKFERVRGELQ